MSSSTISTAPPHISAARDATVDGAIIVTGSNPAIVAATSAWARSAAGSRSP